MKSWPVFFIVFGSETQWQDRQQQPIGRVHFVFNPDGMRSRRGVEQQNNACAFQAFMNLLLNVTARKNLCLSIRFACFIPPNRIAEAGKAGFQLAGHSIYRLPPCWFNSTSISLRTSFSRSSVAMDKQTRPTISSPSYRENS